MKPPHPGSAFWTLVGAAAMLTVFLMTAIFRTVLAGCPESRGGSDLACLFVPTHSDLGVHLLSYVLMGTLLVGGALSLASWRRQWSGLASLRYNLGVLRTSDARVEELAASLGLKGKVHVLDTQPLVCFCSGLRSPQVFVSRGLADKLTRDELEALLLHEKHHMDNRDPLRMLLGRLVVSALGFAPILKDILERYLIEKEIAADVNAIRHQGHHRGIAGALDKLARQGAIAPVQRLAVSATEALSYRIDHLAGLASRPGYRFSLSHVIVSFLFTASALAVLLAPLSGSHP